MIKNDSQTPLCTCPSGNGSLRHPCPAHPAAERSELWAVHAQGPDELYAAFTREDAEKHAAALNALPMPEGIAVGAVVVPSPWPAVQHWQYLAEQEQDHKNEIAGRLRQLERICEGLPQDAIDGGWTVQGIRGYAKRLEDQLKAALARVAELEHVLQVVVNAADHGSWPTTVMYGIEKVREVLAGSGAPSQAQHSVPGIAESVSECMALAQTVFARMEGLMPRGKKLPEKHVARRLLAELETLAKLAAAPAPGGE